MARTKSKMMTMQGRQHCQIKATPSTHAAEFGVLICIEVIGDHLQHAALGGKKQNNGVLVT